jgi:two-component system, cell cycle sensor histidine kinase and response regulator CckA
MNILIVDDKDENQYLLEVLLTGNGQRVVIAANGAEAIEKMKSNRFDLIISDILMPVMDGFQLCRTVKADETTRNIPFIFYTATYTGPQDEEFAIKIGADHFMIKPCEPDIFIKTVHDVMAATERRTIVPPPAGEEEILKLYSERLVRKLEQKMLEAEKEVKARREAEEKYRILVENANEAICVAQDRILRFANERTEELIGCSREELTSRPFIEFIHPEDRDMVLERHLKRLKGIHVPSAYPFRIVRPTGEIRWVDLNVVGINWEGKPGTLCFMRDITDRRQAEEEREKLREQLQQAQKMESIGRLAGGVAHDFNNLLSIILGYGEIVLSELTNDHPHHEPVYLIHQAGIRAKNLTRQLLAFSRKQIMEMQPTDVNTVVTGFEKLLRRIIGEDIELKLTLSDRKIPIMTDISQMEQVLMNLAVNARDAMPEGGTLTIETADAELDEHYMGQRPVIIPGVYAMINVSDTGCGMDRSTMGHIFEPFFTTKEKDKGTGLGLATSYGIIKQHGGYIWAYSEPGQGATFKIYLPLGSGKAPQELKKSKNRKPIIRSATVLVVEDDPTVRALTVHILKDVGYQVLAFGRPEEAVDSAIRYDKPIHLVLSDVIMPGMNGPEMFQKIAEHHPETRALYMSGYAEDNITRRGVLQEGLHFLQKPFSLNGLLEKVDEILKE